MSVVRSGASAGTGGGRLVVMTANSAWNIVNFRSALVAALIANGFRVTVLAPDEPATRATIEGLGASFEPIPLQSSGMSPLADLRLFLSYLRHFRRLKPFAMLGYTVKPNIYGSLAAGLCGTRVINNISGLGTAFLQAGTLQNLVSRLYRAALRRSRTVFFQNGDDRALFAERGLVRDGQTALLPGSGIDLDHFAPRPSRKDDGDVRFLLIARLLWDKGVGEFVDAARSLRERHPNAKFELLGFLGADNRSAVPKAVVESWVAEGLIDYLGQTDDVRDAIAQADCVVLPSYREGMPRSLIEAAAMGKPVIASDVPGCRDAVIAGETGLLCAARSAEDLARAMDEFLTMCPDDRAEMGRSARKWAEQTFDQHHVIDAYLHALRD